MKKKRSYIRGGTCRTLHIGDLHSGHCHGLTHPDWFSSPTNPTTRSDYKYQKWAWETFNEYLDEFRPFDKVFITGDCIEGKGKKNGTRELIYADRKRQTDIATACIKETRVDGENIAIARGTCYHVGSDECWEDVIATNLGATVENHIFAKINGVGLSVRHFVGSSQSPQGKATALLRTQVSNDQWTREYEEHPDARVFVRGHVHRNIVIDEPSTLSFVTPSLQGWTDYGAKQCSLPVHFGIMVLDITEKGDFSQWYRRTAKLGQFVHVLDW